MSACDCGIEKNCEHPMASASTHTVPSTSSTSIHRRKYEVFLSFRGVDTRHGFTDHLYAALKRIGIIVFRDDEELERGEEIHPGLKDAITASQYAVVVISEKFAESKSCLFELSAIMECRRMGHLTVYPVFYKVDPSEVKNQVGHFGEVFAKLENDPKVGTAEWEKWKAILNEIGNCSVDFSKVNENPLNSCRDALKKVGKLSGWHVKDRSESEVVEEISLKILHGLICNLPNISTPLVGIESPANEVLTLLDIQADDAEAEDIGIVGICGMGGVGKTTLAKVVYGRVFSQFQAHCFISIRKNESSNLKKELISNILSQEVANSLKNDIEVDNALHYRLNNTKTFIVLDNVDNKEEVEALIGNRAWFGGGSRIILISKDSHLLKLFDAKIYTVNELERADALKLFSLKAFKKAFPKKHFEELSTTFVEFAKGLPLALEVFGSFLYRRQKHQWENYRNKLEACLDEKVLCILEVSFEGLESLQKELFLDIAYFFNGFSMRIIIPVLKSFGFNLIDLDVLVEKSMLKITEHRELFMHDLLVRMCQDLEGRRKHDKCKRLWRSEDIIQGSGTKGVIALNHAKEGTLCFDTVSNMRYLRMLKIVYPHKDFEGAVWYGNRLESKLTNNFRVLEWFKFPFLYLSPDSQPQNLIKLKLPNGSTEQLQFEFEMFHFLTQIDLSGSKNLTKTSDLPQVRDLKIADLSPRDNLIQVDSPLGSHNRVQRVELHFSNIPGRSSDLASNCSSDQSSSEMLNLFDCRLPNEAFSGYLSGLYSLKSLLQRWKKFTRIPEDIYDALSSIYAPRVDLAVFSNLGPLYVYRPFNYEVSKIGDKIECGAVPGARIPKWFSGKSTNLFGTFRSFIYLNLDDYMKGWMGYALYIVYERCDDWPIFHCELKVDGYRVGLGVPFTFYFYKFPLDRLNGAWVFITAAEFKKLKSQNSGGILRASIATSGLNVKVTGCWTRVVWEHDVSGFYDALRSVDACPHDLLRLQKLLPNMGTLSVLGPDEEKSSRPNNVVIVDDNDDDDIGLANDDEIVETQQLELPRCQDMTDKESQTQELDMQACLDSRLGHGNQSLESINLERCLHTPKSPIALPRQEHLEIAELTDQERRPYQVRRCFRVQRRRQVKLRRRDLPLRRDPCVGRRNEFVSSWQFLRCQFFLHGRRNSVAAVCLLLTAFALLVFPSSKISDLENELCPT